jgi:hypothetical protein
MISRERGLKGLSIFIIILFTYLGFSGEKWLHELLGEAMWLIIACNYINPFLGCLGFIHSFVWGFFIHSCSFLCWVWHGNLWLEVERH